MKMRTRQSLKDKRDKELNGLKSVAVLNMLLMCAKSSTVQACSPPPSGGSEGVSDSNQYPVVRVTAMSVLDGQLGENMFVLLNVTVSCQINSHRWQEQACLIGLRQFHREFIINMQSRGTQTSLPGFICR